jgi:hypothetical protein
VVSRISAQKAAQDTWRAWLAERLPGDLITRITAVAERDGVLILGVASAGWAARLRYALAEGASEGEPVRVVVRVVLEG